MRLASLVIALGCLSACGSSPAPGPRSTVSQRDSAPAPGAESADATAHLYPGRREIMRVMRGPHIDDELRACGLLGAFQVRLALRGSDGSVESVALVERPTDDGSPSAVLAPEQLGLDPSAWACGERVFKTLRVAPFQQATFAVSYPYRL